MKRFCYLVALMVLSSSAQAGSSLSFVVGGHRVSIDAPGNCRSASCVSVSIPGVYETRRGRDRNDDIDDAPTVAVPAKPAAPAPAPVSLPVGPPASKSSIEPVAPAPPRPATVALAASTTQEVAAPPQPKFQASERPPMPPLPTQPVTQPTGKPADAVRQSPDAAAQVSRVSHEQDDEAADLPVGDWQAGAGSVRIERCGRALCGYALIPSSNAAGEMLLINMKPRAASEWSGNIYRRDSGSTYYATMAMKGRDSLRVEACALGKFFCSDKVWSRIGAQPEKLITSRQISAPPPS
jgi:uncharacterized protein (DUF2147 family)